MAVSGRSDRLRRVGRRDAPSVGLGRAVSPRRGASFGGVEENGARPGSERISGRIRRAFDEPVLLAGPADRQAAFSGLFCPRGTTAYGFLHVTDVTSVGFWLPKFACRAEEA